jgi:hypothetical protein
VLASRIVPSTQGTRCLRFRYGVLESLERGERLILSKHLERAPVAGLQTAARVNAQQPGLSVDRRAVTPRPRLRARREGTRGNGRRRGSHGRRSALPRQQCEPRLEPPLGRHYYTGAGGPRRGLDSPLLGAGGPRRSPELAFRQTRMEPKQEQSTTRSQQ